MIIRFRDDSCGAVKVGIIRRLWGQRIRGGGWGIAREQSKLNLILTINTCGEIYNLYKATLHHVRTVHRARDVHDADNICWPSAVGTKAFGGGRNLH